MSKTSDLNAKSKEDHFWQRRTEHDFRKEVSFELGLKSNRINGFPPMSCSLTFGRSISSHIPPRVFISFRI